MFPLLVPELPGRLVVRGEHADLGTAGILLLGDVGVAVLHEGPGEALAHELRIDIPADEAEGNEPAEIVLLLPDRR